MHLNLQFGTYLCYTPEFMINGKDAYQEDFGEKYDRCPELAEDYSCGNMQFTRIEPTKEVLEKYGITVEEYNEIASKLEDGLSFGRCGLCS